MTVRTAIHAIKKLGFVAPILAASIAGVGAIAPEAQAGNLVPQEEGEVDVGLGACLGTDCSYLDLSSTLIESIVSLEDDSTGTFSRLFVDKAGTEDTYGGVFFESEDLGTAETSSGDYWFRPVAMLADKVTPSSENGQLEVGTFKVTFKKALEDLTVKWFDTEKDGTSYTIGDDTDSTAVAKGGNNNIKTETFTDVKAITLNLGEFYGEGKFNDGVNFQVHTSVPEPGLMMGLGAFAIAGGLGLRKRQGDNTAA